MIAAACAALLAAACGDSNLTTAPTSVAAPGISAETQNLPTLKGRTEGPCVPLDLTSYVGPVNPNPGVHGTTVDLVFPGNDLATRGYEIRIERRLGLSSNYVIALTTVVLTNNPSILLGSEGRYRATVRGLGCNDSVGAWTDPYVYFSTDGVGGDASSAPVIVPPPPGGEVPPPPSDDDGNNGHGNDPGNNDDSNPGQGGGNNDTPPPPPPTHGNDCHIGTNVMPWSLYGKPSGDHNNDGHNDCGQGNTNPHGN